MVRIHHGTLAGDLNHDLVQRKFAVEGLRCSENAVVPDHAALDCRAVLQFDDARDDAGVGEVNLMQALTALCEDHAMFQSKGEDAAANLRSRPGLLWIEF